MCAANMSPCRHIAPIRPPACFIWEKHQIKRVTMEGESNVWISDTGYLANNAAGLYPATVCCHFKKKNIDVIMWVNNECRFIATPNRTRISFLIVVNFAHQLHAVNTHIGQVTDYHHHTIYSNNTYLLQLWIPFPRFQSSKGFSFFRASGVPLW